MKIFHTQFVKSFIVSRKLCLSVALTLPLALTACNQTSQSQPEDKHSADAHDHEAHAEQEDGHAHEHHDEPDAHAGEGKEQTDATHEEHAHHEEHKNHEDHEEGHEGHEGHEHHDHDHNHGSGEKQVIPEGYAVNFAVSNHPLLLLSEAVTQGTPTTVQKLLGAGDVGHHGSLSPSDMKTVKDSKYVVWFGEALESNLSNTLTKAPNVVTMLDNKSLAKLDRRNEKAEVIKGNVDPHVWLEPKNAKVIVNELAKLHAQTNPEYADSYKQNAKKFASDIDALVAKHQAKRSEHKQYWSSHDAFQYLEAPLNIKLAGTLTIDHEIPAKASQIVWLNNNRPYQSMCLLAQSEPKEGIKDKLKPVKTSVLVEDMSDSMTFLEAWNTAAESVQACVE